MLMLGLDGFAVTQLNFGGMVKKENKFMFFGLKVANERRRYGEGGKQLPVYRYESRKILVRLYTQFCSIDAE